MLGLGGGREVIGLQVAPAGTEDPEKKPEVRHLTGGDPSGSLCAVIKYNSTFFKRPQMLSQLYFYLFHFQLLFILIVASCQ